MQNPLKRKKSQIDIGAERRFFQESIKVDFENSFNETAWQLEKQRIKNKEVSRYICYLINHRPVFLVSGNPQSKPENTIPQIAKKWMII